MSKAHQRRGQHQRHFKRQNGIYDDGFGGNINTINKITYIRNTPFSWKFPHIKNDEFRVKRAIYLASPLPGFDLLPFFQPGVINFCGATAELNLQINKLGQQQRNSVSYLNIAIQGTRMQQSSPCCFWTTCGLSFLIIPLCIIFSDCYKKAYSQLYNLSDNDYNTLNKVIKIFPNATHIQLHVQDNQINAHKTKMIENAVLNAGKTHFNFQNHAVKIGSNFVQLFGGLKSTNTIQSKIIWGSSKYFTTPLSGVNQQINQLELYGPKYLQLFDLPQISQMYGRYASMTKKYIKNQYNNIMSSNNDTTNIQIIEIMME